ncbi:MAG TPA: metallophosphoesterase, partial [Vicinamibacterales bacterium]|nr:metallophosphoesterase [Vicinamibacterales bacterium]
MRRRLTGFILALFAASTVLLALGEPLPNRPGSIKFAVIGDNGTGETPQYDVGRQMAASRTTFPFDFVIMLGDNFYGSQRPKDRVKKFEQPYRALLDAGVTFHAALGNHDAADSVDYPPLNMGGRRYYTFERGPVRFFVLDTNNLDPSQLAWFRQALADAREPWRICYFHHPLYSNAGRHGSAVDLRVLIEPLLVRHGVSVVFSGHDHAYERVKPQKGIHYFVAGSGGKLRRGDMEPSDQTAAAFDRDQAFMLVEVAESELYFQAVSRTGVVVDSGAIANRNVAALTEGVRSCIDVR